MYRYRIEYVDNYTDEQIYGTTYIAANNIDEAVSEFRRFFDKEYVRIVEVARCVDNRDWNRY